MAKTLTTPCRQKGSASKIQVPCTDVIQMCNKGMGGVDFIHQRAAVYHLYRKPCIRFHFVHIFDLIDLACANSYIVYSMMHPNDLTLLDFETIFSTYLITRYESRNTAPPDGKRGSKERISIILSKVTYHHIFQKFKISRVVSNIATKKEMTWKRMYYG